MKISVITPNYNGERFLEETIKSVIAQQDLVVDVEYIIVDGGSTDGSQGIINKYRSQIYNVISEPDHGPANAINKGLRIAGGDILCWLNADDRYYPGALKRVAETMANHPKKALCFGHCPIINENGKEIRIWITRFKELFFPISSHFAIQCINYISQPAMFFRSSAYKKAGPLREDLICAWDYDFVLRLCHQGGLVQLNNPPLAMFRWHEESLGGRYFKTQFEEELDIATQDAGKYSVQVLLHFAVRWGIVLSYSLMAYLRKRKNERENRR